MGSKWFADVVFDYLMKNKNVEVTIQELMDETGRERHQIQGAINNLRRRKGAIILAPSPGRVFVYQGMAQAENVVREDGSVVSRAIGAGSTSQLKVVETLPSVESVMEKTEQRLKANPENKETFGTALGREGIELNKTQPKPTGQFKMPRPHMDNEFMRVISRKKDRVILEDAEGEIWQATSI